MTVVNQDDVACVRLKAFAKYGQEYRTMTLRYLTQELQCRQHHCGDLRKVIRLLEKCGL